MNILIAVTHLLGIGHLARMRVLARGLAANGHTVTLISGGRAQPHLDGDGIDLVQLPPVHCTGTDFSTLYEADGIVLSDATRNTRIAMILETLVRVNPDIVITETFPFGRRALKSEFLALCERADAMRPRPAIVSSIRDLLNPPSKPAKAEEAERFVARFFDGILVHGDATLVPPQAGWPFGPYGARALHLTGYIDDTQTTPDTMHHHDAIVVSGGGSAASLPLYRAACDAALLLPDQKWHILIGHGVTQDAFDTLIANAPANTIIERARRDFRALLAGARLSISQAGYNTIVDLLATRRPMVLVPFAAGQEQEQTLRARVLQEAGWAQIVSEGELKGPSLAEAVTDALALPPCSNIRIDLDGVNGSMAALIAIKTHRDDIEAAWDTLASVLIAAKARGETIDVWWRDDDATEATPQLARLLALSRETDAPVALAVIPDRVADNLVAASEDMAVLIHGIAHRNHAPADHKKQELGFQPTDTLIDALRDRRERLAQRFGARALPVLVPPWNRIDSELVARLREAGIAGLSTYKRRAARMAAPGVMQINTHCDPIDWRGGGGLLPEAALVRQFARLIAETAQEPVDAREPLGLLSHHLVHDEAVWAFLGRFLSTLSQSGAVRFVSAASIFDKHQMVPPPVMVE
jgi:predicted glycosyltransferase